MKKEDMFEAVNGIDDEYIEKSEAKPKNKSWVKLGGIAACLCLVIIGAFAIFKPAEPGGGVDAGGNVDGMAGHYSIAVFPPDESLENVADAQIITLSEAEAYSFETLGAHLPTELPEGYYYHSAYLYDTTMKDGTKYNSLRVTYANGEYPEEIVTEDGGVQVPDMNEMPDEFLVIVSNFKPTEEIELYYSGDTEELKNGGVWVEIAGGVYGFFEAFELSDDEFMIIVESMN